MNAAEVGVVEWDGPADAMAEEQGLVESASESGIGELPLPDLDIDGPENPTDVALLARGWSVPVSAG